MRRIFPILIIIALLISGCSSQKSLKTKPMQTYINQKAGYVVLMPKEWVKKFENDVSVGFVGTDPNIALDVVFEIGGVDYLSLDSLGDIVIANYKKKFKNLKVIESAASNVTTNAYRVIVEGKTADGKNIVAKTIFFEPAIGVRYYLSFIANPKDYYANDFLFENVAQSFQMTKTELDLYKLLASREEEEFKKKHTKEVEKYKEETKQQKAKTDKSN